MSGKIGWKSFVFQKLSVALLGFSGVAAAQTAGSGTITGTVTDVSKSVVPDATVVVHNVETGADRSVTTNGAGIFAAPFLQPGITRLPPPRRGLRRCYDRTLVFKSDRR
jgi:hypothetical protein